MKPTSTLPVIGRSALITIGGVSRVPAKVDTGADSSSVWASAVREVEGRLHLTLFGDGSTFCHPTEIVIEDYKTVHVRSSNGEHNQRFVVYLPVEVDDTRYEHVRFTLADRTSMRYPVLLGRHFLEGSFLVDVSQEIPRVVHDQLFQERKQRLQQKSGLH